MKVRGADHFLK